MFEERLKDIIADVYCGRVLVFSNYTARETLYAKGISPAIFLHKYYAQMTNDLRISYSIKEKAIKQMFQICPIDAEEYECLKDEKLNKVLRDRILSKSKLPKQFKKEELDSKALIENYLKSLNYFWFEEASKTFLYAMSLEQSNFKLSTLEQPIGIAFVLELQKGQSIKNEYQKIRKEVESKMKKMFHINPARIKNIPTVAIILHNVEKGISSEQCQGHLNVLRQQYRFESNLLCKVEINSPAAKDSVDWSSYPRAILKIDYKLKASDPVRLFGENEEIQLRNFIFNHRQKIRAYLQERIRYLGFRYEENNTTKNKFINFFKGSSNSERAYNAEQAEMREIADFLFLIGDFKKALDLYKDLAEKFQSSERDQLIYYNVCEMIQLSKCMHAFLGGQKMKVYESIKAHAEKTMLKRAHGIGKQKIYRYLVYITYFLHGFKIFDKEFIKNSYYYYIKKGVNDQTLSQQTPYPSIIPALIHQQYANINLLYPIPDYRRYGYDIVRVASKFNQFRLHDHHLRCLLIASYIYKNTFPIIQKYINSSLSRTYLELKKYRFSLERIQLTWKNLMTMYEDVPLPQVEQENQFTKLYNTQLRALSQIQRVQPHQLTRQTDDCIQIPKLTDVKIDVVDQRLQNNQSLGSKWQDVGDVFLGQTELTSKGMSKQNMMKSLKMFDAITAQQKELAYRIKGMGNGPFSEPVIKRNVRCAFIGEPITFSFSFKNPLPINIDVTNLLLHLKVPRKCKIVQKEPTLQKLTFRPGQKINVVFQIIPQEAGVYEFSHISWTFFKMTSIYRFLQPWQSKSNLKSLYYKLNVLEECGKLSVRMQHGSKIYEGQKAELELVLKNEGSQPIDEIYLAIDNFNIFGFKLKRVQITISPGETKILKLNAQMPILKSTDFLKCITKAIFLYRTSTQFRVQRAVTCFNIERITQIKDITCERISKSLVFLSFSLKYPSVQKNQLSLLKSLIIQGGFEIKKVETNNLESLCHYFFFLRKNQQSRELEQFKLTSHSLPALKIVSQFAESNKQLTTDQDQVKKNNRMRLYFWWCDDQGREGVINPQPITITATERGPNKTRLPFNVKILLKDEIECNLEQSMFVELEVHFSIKNIYENKDIKVLVQLRDGDLNEFYWEGKTNHQLILKYNEEREFKLKLIIMRTGIFNIARNIRYSIFTNKTNSYPIIHSEYESVYLEVRDIKNQKELSHFDFFQQFQPALFKKAQMKEPVQESYDLI